MTAPSITDYPYYYHHNSGCGGEAFYLKRMPQPGDVVTAADSIYTDGTHPETGDDIVCGACGEKLMGGDVRTSNIHPREEVPRETTLA